MNIKNTKWLLGGIFVLAMLAHSTTASAAEIKVICSAGLKAVMEELIPQFEQTTKHKVAIEYGVSAVLKRQIESGEAFDLAILTPAFIDDLIKQGKIVGDTKSAVARTGMALMIKVGARKPDISTTDALKRTLLASKSIAYGKEGASGVFFDGLMKKLNLTEALQSKLALTSSGEETGGRVAKGESDLGVLAVSEILPLHGVEVLGTFPADLQSYMVMVGGVSSSSKQAGAAKELLNSLMAPSALPVIKKKGMERG